MPTPPVRGLFVGLTTLDVVHRVPTPPAANTKLTATRQDLAAGGPAANAAVTFAALGGRAQLLTALGDGPAASAARDDLERHGVEVLDVAPPGFELAVSAVAVHEVTGERSVVSPDAGAVAVVPPPGVPDLVTDTDVVLLDGHHPALQLAVARAARAAGVTVVLDAGRWKPHLADVLPLCDVVAASADFRLGDGGAAGSAQEVAPGVLALDVPAVAVTHGGDPVEWWTLPSDASGRPVRGAGVEHGVVDVPRVTAVDTLGAGDAFHGALAHALASGALLVDAIVGANAVASLRVSVPGPRAWLARLAASADDDDAPRARG